MEDRETGNASVGGNLRVLSRADLEAEVRKRTAELQNIMDTMADVLVTLDPGGRIEMANAAVEEVLGYEPSDVEGRPVTFLFAGTDREEFSSTIPGTEFVDRLVTGGTITDLEVAFETADGREIPMKLSASVMREDGAVTGYVCVAKDITELKRRERELQRQNEYLDEFASVVSHDIATPLGVIENKARLIELTGETAHTEDIFEATEGIQSLIDDLLELAREGKRVGDTEPVDLETVTRRAWASIETSAATLTVASSTRIEAGPDRLRQLLENLLGNSVEHGQSGSGGVHVRVGTLPDGFYVEDDGPGIPESDREEVFTRGYTTDGDGTGLGLAIVGQIASGHDWSVDVTDGEAGGARFEIRTGRTPASPGDT